MKNRKITFRLDQQTHEILKGIAGLDECNMSELIRHFIQTNINAFIEFHKRTNDEVIKWWLREQARAAIGA